MTDWSHEARMAGRVIAQLVEKEQVLRDELAAVKAERDALLAAYIGFEPANDISGMGGPWPEKWTASVPHVQGFHGGGFGVAFEFRVFKSREAAESAILAAARAAADQRAKGEKGGVS